MKRLVVLAYALHVIMLKSTPVDAHPTDKREPTSQVQSAYDFIIVGGGLAGLVVANRLSECNNISVLVLEAGPDPNNVVSYKTPGAAQQVLGTTIDWGFVTAPQASLNGRAITYHRGRALGGSTTINGLLYGRGSSSIYDLWQSLGNANWSWTNVLPYFQKSSTFLPSTSGGRYETGEAGAYAGGPLQLTYPVFETPSSIAFIEALSTINVPITPDLNLGSNIGTKQGLMTLDANMSRSSAYDSYYLQAKDRPNLIVKIGAMAQQITWAATPDGTLATGVIYSDSLTGNTVTVTANKEVILSAGTFQTPQILMLSGVGPAESLKKFGIKQVIVNENVGQHMQDHNYFSIIARAQQNGSSSQTYNNIANLQAAESQYKLNKSGPLTGPIGPCNGWQQLPPAVLQSLNATELLNNRTDQAHIEYLFENIYYPGTPSWMMRTQYPPNLNESFFSVTAGLVAPVSRGNVTLQSNNIQDLPIINLNYYEAETDQKLAVHAFKNLRTVLAQAGLQAYVKGGNNGEVVPGIEVQSDVDILDYIRDTAIPIWHVSGTCRMLPLSQGGVVDSRLRLYGARGLRIVDASIIPVIPDQHTQGPVYMIAEKAAQMIKEDWGV